MQVLPGPASTGVRRKGAPGPPRFATGLRLLCDRSGIAGDGTYSIDLNGSSQGVIAQVLATQPGTTYGVQFLGSANCVTYSGQSCATTCTAGAIAWPAAALVGCCAKTSAAAGPDAIENVSLVAGVKPLAVALSR